MMNIISEFHKTQSRDLLLLFGVVDGQVHSRPVAGGVLERVDEPATAEGGDGRRRLLLHVPVPHVAVAAGARGVRLGARGAVTDAVEASLRAENDGNRSFARLVEEPARPLDLSTSAAIERSDRNDLRAAYAALLREAEAHEGVGEFQDAIRCYNRLRRLHPVFQRLAISLTG